MSASPLPGRREVPPSQLSLSLSSLFSCCEEIFYFIERRFFLYELCGLNEISKTKERRGRDETLDDEINHDDSIQKIQHKTSQVDY
tara:strand:- start:1912 stop:2169 length:258 start_codon:yes stop_codon:yes gene_type:complete